MNKSFWKEKLVALLVPNAEMNKQGMDVYGLGEKRKITLWFEGGLKISGDAKTLTLNFTDPDLMVVSTLIRKTIRIYRIPYARLVCFESIFEGKDESLESVSRFSLN